MVWGGGVRLNASRRAGRDLRDAALSHSRDGQAGRRPLVRRDDRPVADEKVRVFRRHPDRDIDRPSRRLEVWPQFPLRRAPFARPISVYQIATETMHARAAIFASPPCVASADELFPARGLHFHFRSGSARAGKSLRAARGARSKRYARYARKGARLRPRKSASLGRSLQPETGLGANAAPEPRRRVVS
jgi:hypothetical protein